MHRMREEKPTVWGGTYGMGLGVPRMREEKPTVWGETYGMGSGKPTVKGRKGERGVEGPR